MELEQILEKSVDISTQTLSAVLGKSPVIFSNQAMDRIVNREPIVVNLGFANFEWQGILTMGGSKQDLLKIIDASSVELCVDALGEILNTIAGSIAFLPEAQSLFGQMNQTTPVMLEGGTFFPKSPQSASRFSF
jgi:hypothetical protein